MCFVLAASAVCFTRSDRQQNSHRPRTSAALLQRQDTQVRHSYSVVESASHQVIVVHTYLIDHSATLVYLTDHTNKLTNSFVACLNECRYTLAVPVQWREARSQSNLVCSIR